MERQNTEAPTSALLLEGRDCPLKAGISLCMSKAPSAVTPQHFSRSVTDPLSAILATRTKLGWFFCCFVSNKDQISGAILEKVWHSPAKKKKRCVVERLLCVLNVCWQPARMLLPQQRPDAREGESSSEQLQLLIAEQECGSSDPQHHLAPDAGLWGNTVAI